MTGFAPDLNLASLFPRHRAPSVVLSGAGPDGRPILTVGSGPLLATSECSLTVRPILDVNGYYAALGVAASATRHQLARAYAALPPERRTAWLTEALMILLDPVRRRVYDGLGLGDRFNDSETRSSLRRAAVLRHLRTRRIGVPETVYELDLDTPYSDSRYAPEGHAVQAPERWGYAHYLWGTHTTGTEALATWQGMLVRALNDDLGPPMRFAVGRRSPGSGTTAILIDGHPAAFLPADTPPDPHQAAQAAQAMREL